MATIEIDTSDLKRLKAKMDLFPRESQRAMVESLNRTISKTISITANEVKSDYPSIKRKDLKGKVKKANYNNLQAEIEYSGTRLKASFFPHKISRSKNRSPVTLKIKSAVKSGADPIMFGEGVGGARGARGTREVFKRYPGTRQTKTVYTLSIPQMVSNEDVYNRISKEAAEHFEKTFEHQLDYRIGMIADK